MSGARESNRKQKISRPPSTSTSSSSSRVAHCRCDEDPRAAERRYDRSGPWAGFRFRFRSLFALSLLLFCVLIRAPLLAPIRGPLWTYHGPIFHFPQDGESNHAAIFRSFFSALCTLYDSICFFPAVLFLCSFVPSLASQLI